MRTHANIPLARYGSALLALGLCALPSLSSAQQRAARTPYEHRETRELVELVDDAAHLVQEHGAAAFDELRRAGSRWRHEDRYVFVLSLDGVMRVHPDAALEGKPEIDLRDVHGKPIIRGLLDAATAVSGRPTGWYHYEWPVPGGILPRWKSSYVRLVDAPGGERFLVGSGVYDDGMERAFVVDTVERASALLAREGQAAFPKLRDPTGPFVAKDAYLFVIDPRGVELVNAAFPNLEGRNVIDVRDTRGKKLVREMIAVVDRRGAGWVDYQWPRPGDSFSTRKSTYVARARLGKQPVIVGCGVYLEGAPRSPATVGTVRAPELVARVHDAAALLAVQGEKAFPAMRVRGSRWFRGDDYCIVFSPDGTRLMHAGDPSLEGQRYADAKDVVGRPYGRMFLDVATSAEGKGWIHYMFPRPGDLFPAWKSTYVERVTFPSGKQELVGCGGYHVERDRAFVEDVVDRAAALVERLGPAAFAKLRDHTGPFVFMDTYVFVDSPDGTELVNPAQPTLEGTSVRGLRDVDGKQVAAEYIDTAMRNGSAWVEYHWYRPGESKPVRKRSYVRKVKWGNDVFLVGSGMYLD